MSSAENRSPESPASDRDAPSATRSPGFGAPPTWRRVTPSATGLGTAESIAVVLGYYNGDRFLTEQVRSIARQTHPAVELFIADDASPTPVDEPSLRDIAGNRLPTYLARAQANRGLVRNFLQGLAAVPPRFEYFAFSDQDDIWYADKLERAVAVMRECSPDTPALYCARTAITDATGTRHGGLSPLIERAPSFTNALLENIAGGNTMVFNRAARDLIVRSSLNQAVTWHDWWCYQIVAGAGGVVHYDSRPCLSYRQHESNFIGANGGWRARIVRIQGLLDGEYQRWNRANIAALQANRRRITPANQARLEHFAAAVDAGLPHRLWLFRQSGAHRQHRLQNMAVWIGVLLHRV